MHVWAQATHIFLLFEERDNSQWKATLADSRSAYAALKHHFLRYIEHPDEVGAAVDPLDDDATSPWNTLRQDEALRIEIFQDVERCMTDNAYFRLPSTQKLLLDILFIFCKLNQDVGYRQGMHELLAPILWVVECDAVERTPDLPGEGGVEAERDLIQTVLDSKFVEDDAFTIFCLLMHTAKSFYEISDLQPRPYVSGSGLSQGSAIVERSQRIHEHLLAQVDPELADHLTRIDILPQVFVIRWIRLLFGREFPFDQVLRLWDVLIAVDPALQLVDLVCVSMLLRIRWRLLEADYSTALTLLLRYPSLDEPHGPHTLVDDALYLRDNSSPVGGSHLISKYTGKSPDALPDATGIPGLLSPDATLAAGNLSPKRKDRHIRTKSPLSSPVRFIQQQGGVEALLQDTAKAVLQRGEKWGVNKAVRDAMGEVKRNVQGLQSAGSSPRRGQGTLRWSLDDSRHEASTFTLMQQLAELEQRNKILAKMLDSAVEGFWSRTSMGGDLPTGSISSTGDETFDLAVAKVQFVKVHLEDSTLSLPTTESASTPAIVDGALNAPIPDGILARSSIPKKQLANRSKRLSSAAAGGTDTPASVDIFTADSSSQPAATESEKPPRAAPPSPPKEKRAPVKHSRSSLAQSSFAWMLGEDEPRSGFVASNPSSSKGGEGRSKGKGKRSSLFGEGGEDGSTRNDEDDESHGFKLGTWKGGKPPSPEAQ
ncbi:MAG: hypothetical protein M1825_006433 [Sarcosagium campestre]|nr:MAG: hypothetical protein M1825_006433 [Sarcosagium campestre]